MMPPPPQALRSAVRAALDEDLSTGDVTTETLFPHPVRARGTIFSHQRIVVAGVSVACCVFDEVDSSLRCTPVVADGQLAQDGDRVLTVEGDARSILMAERVALNFLQHLSGIATLTARFRHTLRGYRTSILDTRKTLPGLRALQKWAVRLGGGKNHRFSLGEGIFIKDNHLALLQAEGLDLADACRRAKERAAPEHRMIVEVQSLEQVRKALSGGADVILLDNMAPELARKAVELIKGRAQVELSGGVTLDNALELAATGVDAVSVGALTHSAPAVNLSLDLVPLTRSSRTPRARTGKRKG